ncbi:type II secretion system protein, partial [Roseateles sp.]|uniref:type II secretion system protein n=1 Tax=Roseateles sp. TaxID=1971397 RepID=UPI002F3FDE83
MSARARARPRPVPTAVATSQSGFSLIEVTMALMLLGAMSLGMLQLQQFQQRVESGRLAGLRLAALRDGAERYARDHSDALLAALRSVPACADIPLSRKATAETPTPTGCALAMKDDSEAQAPVKPLAANALQPTFQELRALGYVMLDDRLPFPHGDTIVDGRTGRTAEPRWAVSVQCHALCDTAAGARAAILRVTLYNTQPFFAQDDDALPFGYGAQLKAALQALGPDAMVSLPGESAQTAARLRGQGTAP